MSVSQEQKGRIFMEKGQKKLNSWSFMSSAKYEEAAEFFEKAANCYKMAKNYDEAAEAYARTSECHLKLEAPHEAATALVSAANVKKKSSVVDAIGYLSQAVDLYTDEGRFAIAAKHQKTIGEMYEAEMQFEEAIEAYQQAADMFEGEGSQSSADACLIKVAFFAAQLEQYDKAVELYEQVARGSMDNLRKWSVKDYFLRAGLCLLAAGDVVKARQALTRYCDSDASFATTREGELLSRIVAAVEAYHVDDFTDAVVEYDAITKLDAWKTSMLLKVKNTIKDASADAGDVAATDAVDDGPDLT